MQVASWIFIESSFARVRRCAIWSALKLVEICALSYQGVRDGLDLVSKHERRARRLDR